MRRLRASFLFFAVARPLSRTDATAATSMTHFESRTIPSIWSAEQEWSPEIAGNAAKSMQPGFFPWSPAHGLSQSRSSCPFRASAQRRSSVALRAGSRPSIALPAMFRCSG